MLPDLAHLKPNEPTHGKAFQVLVEQIGVGRQRREVSIKAAEWEACVACPDYRSCYDLSMATLALQNAIGIC